MQKTTPKYRSFASQLCAIFPYVCLQFTYGTLMGVNVILIAELRKSDSEIPTSLDQLSWFAGLDFVKLVGTPINGLLSQRLGSRVLALVVAFSDVSRLLMYYYSTTATLVLVGRALGSLSTIYPVAAAHISEISEPRYRGSFLAVTQLATTVGSFFSVMLASLLYWRTIMLVNLAFPVIAAVTVLATPNSPTWLAGKGRLDEAKTALCWTRGWVEPQQVQVEFQTIVDNVNKPSQDDQKLSLQTRTRNFFELFLQRSFYAPFGSMCLMILVYCSSGMSAIILYSTVIFREMNSPIEESVATAIMGAIGVLGSIIVLIIVHRCGKRKLALFGVIVVGSCLAIVAVVGFLELRGAYSWVATIAIVVAYFAESLGGTAILQMLMGELFPPAVRYVGSSMSFAVKMTLMSMMHKAFLYIVEAITLPGVFLFFATMNAVCLVVYYFLFPETEGRTLREIEDHFKGAEKVEAIKK